MWDATAETFYLVLVPLPPTTSSHCGNWTIPACGWGQHLSYWRSSVWEKESPTIFSIQTLVKRLGKLHFSPEIHQFVFVPQQLTLLRAVLCWEVIRKSKRKFQTKISGHWRKIFNANLFAVWSDVQSWKSWFLQVIHKYIRQATEYVIKKGSALGQSWTEWPFHDLLHHCLVQFLLVIHYSEAVYHFVHDKGNFHQSVPEPRIPGFLSK